MLADYVMKGIDNLFQQKLSLKTNTSKDIKTQAKNQNGLTHKQDKQENRPATNSFFNKNYIKENLHRVIKKNYDQQQSKMTKSPSYNQSQNSHLQHMKSSCQYDQNSEFYQRKLKRSVSPISKSRLKLILQHNKQERIKSVVKSKKDHSESKNRSPYTKIQQTISQLSRVTTCANIKELNLNDISINQYNSSEYQKKNQTNSTVLKKTDKISYYRQQRKEMSKSKSRSKIFIQNQEQSHQQTQATKSNKSQKKHTQVYKSRSKIFKNVINSNKNSEISYPNKIWN